MAFIKEYKNGLRLVVEKIEGLFSVSAGVMVKTGSVNEDDENNGISHFIEHTVFKGTTSRSAYEISDYIDSIGAQINAFTSKEMTMYYTKSMASHLKDCLEVLSDIFFNSTFEKTELKKEKGVVIEEINMTEDSPEDLLFDNLSLSYFGNSGLGRTILGPSKNIRKFSNVDIKDYMDKYYTADNVVISVSGNVDEKEVEKMVDDLFAEKFKNVKSKKQHINKVEGIKNIHKYKKIEQAHIGLCFNGYSISDKRYIPFSIANNVLGGGMSSRLFQKVREEMGLSYSVYSYPSSYKDCGVLEIYGGVNIKLREKAFKAIIEVIEEFKKGITNKEFSRGKEQILSSFVMGRENSSSQMLLAGKYLLFLNEIFDFEKRKQKIGDVTFEEVNEVAKNSLDFNSCAISTLGAFKKPLSL